MSASQDTGMIRQDILNDYRHVPIYETLGYQVLELSGGRCRLRMPLQHAYTGSFESFHGGLMMTVADSAAYLAVMGMAYRKLKSSRMKSGISAVFSLPSNSTVSPMSELGSAE